MSKPSAEKRHRQSLKRRQINRSWRKKLHTAEKSVLDQLEAGKPQEAATELREISRLLTRAASRKVIHKKKASRKVGRLSKRLAKSAAKSA
jgi:small subunit ribosomal protein S20